MWGLIEMNRDEYRYEKLGVRDYKITFLKIPIFCARFTTTSNSAVNLLTPIQENRKKIIGFTIEENETKSKSKKNKQKA